MKIKCGTMLRINRNIYETVDLVKTFYLSHNIIGFHVHETLGFRQDNLAGVGLNYFDNPCTPAIALLHFYYCNPGKNCHSDSPNPGSDLKTLTFQIIDLHNIFTRPVWVEKSNLHHSVSK